MEEKKTTENIAWKNRARPAIYAMAGVYVAYLAYCMFKQISVTSGSEQMLMIIFTIVFAILGLGLLLFGLTEGHKNAKEMRKDYHLEAIDKKDRENNNQ